MELWRSVNEQEFVLIYSRITLQVWSLKSLESINTFRVSGDVPVNSIHLIPKSNDQFLICNRTNTVVIVNLQGQVKWWYRWGGLRPCWLRTNLSQIVRTMTSGKREKGGNFLACCLSPKGEWVYCVGEVWMFSVCCDKSYYEISGFRSILLLDAIGQLGKHHPQCRKILTLLMSNWTNFIIGARPNSHRAYAPPTPESHCDIRGRCFAKDVESISMPHLMFLRFICCVVHTRS